MWGELLKWIRRAAGSPGIRRTGVFVARGGQAVAHARRINGRIGVRIIRDAPHWVVWDDGVSVACYPDVDVRPSLDEYLKKKRGKESDADRWVFSPNEVEKALREFLKRAKPRRRQKGPPDDETPRNGNDDSAGPDEGNV